MVAFPQEGGCVCGDVRYTLREDPVTLYACHCTDCQKESGASFTLSMTVRTEAFELLRGTPREYGVELADGRHKGGRYCPRCITILFAPARVPELTMLWPGTLDDTSWLRPAGHIWTRSAQPWVQLPGDAPCFEKQPGDAGALELVRAWKGRDQAGSGSRQ